MNLLEGLAFNTMRYKYITLFLFITAILNGQSVKDSLLLLLKKHPIQDTVRCDLLLKLIEEEEEDKIWMGYNSEMESISMSNLKVNNTLQKTYKKYYATALYNKSYFYSISIKYEEAIIAAKQALVIHRELKNDVAIAGDLNIIANNSYKLGRIDEALNYYKQAINLSKRINDQAGIINLYNNVSNLYFSVGDYKSAIAVLFEELKVATEIESNKDIGDAYNSIGGYYSLQGEDKNALLYFNKGLTLQKQLKNTKGIAFCYQNLGKFYSDRNQFKQALYYFDEALKIEKINEISTTLIFSSQTYFKMREYDKALETLSRALKISTESDEIENTAVILFQMGNIYYEQKKYDLAQEVLEKSLSLSQKIKSLKNTQNCSTLLYKLYKLKNNSSNALQMLELSTTIKDSLNRKENRSTALKADFKYQTEKKEAAIKELMQEKTISDLQSQRKSVLIYSILGGILAIALLSYFLFVRYKSKKQNELLKIQLQEAEKTIHAEKKATESELKALKSQMNPHFIFNALNSIQEQFMYGDKLKGNEQLGNFTYLTRQILTVSGKKQIPLSTEIEILSKYLELEKMRFQNDFEYTISFSENIDEDYVQLPPMMIQPFVENSIKHGLLHKEGLKRLTINFNINEEENYILCTVEDNGIGRTKSAEINANNANSHVSFSTSSIEQRLELLNSKLKLDNLIVYTDILDSNNHIVGTKVEIRIPLL